MAIPEPTATGTVPFGEWETWYRITGELGTGATPVVVLHGGPGAAHNYTLTMARLAEQGRAVVHYDQLGIGNSTHLPDKSADFWTVDLFLAELDNLLAALGIADDYHVIGQSWGGMLGAEHAVRRPAGLRTLTIADSPASMELWSQAADELRAQLPADVLATLVKHEEAGTYDDPEYKKASKYYYDLHVCRIVPNPPEVAATDAAIEADPTVYNTMNGPNEFHCIGTLRDWSVVDEVKSIAVPTLLVNGAYDEATPLTMQPFMDGIPDVRWEVFPESSHMPHVEEEERFLSVVGAFLDEHSLDGHDDPRSAQ
ncbi:proline iminopeptidase-family hydrolase [Nocardioides sp. KR10-350]|uniref:proline iminopeptidase-family hydrolase n=1 Tax=Nocardioides cheoyonin TaxID=3156615 RepID=UPI0032B43AB8